ncbi:hypothetical protein C5167_044016 [Papaver somniferum]|uniref:Uncharacterized protein n=1 Tax=Papaver somniferum TaxID=3469 RepID=A0A4Y7L7D3_PAPSO|nr:hypothetical protein C5167_044016 [Papaver somniferum]
MPNSNIHREDAQVGGNHSHWHYNNLIQKMFPRALAESEVMTAENRKSTRRWKMFIIWSQQEEENFHGTPDSGLGDLIPVGKTSVGNHDAILGDLFKLSNTLKEKIEVMYFVLMMMCVGKVYLVQVDSSKIYRFDVLELLAQFIIWQDLVLLVPSCLYEP